jgi:hypothetical protein
MKFEFTGPNQIYDFFFFIYFYIKTEKFSCLSKVLLFLGQRTGAHSEGLLLKVKFSNLKQSLNFQILMLQLSIKKN